MTLMLVEAGKKGGSRPKHRWTEEERDIVRRDYNGTNASAQGIANRLGVTRCAVKGQVQKMGIAMEKSPDWTEQEIGRLKDLLPRFAPLTVARRLHRSENAVVIKAKRLGLSRRYRDGWYTMRDVCEILASTIIWSNGGLKAARSWQAGIMVTARRELAQPPGTSTRATCGGLLSVMPAS